MRNRLSRAAPPVHIRPAPPARAAARIPWPPWAQLSCLEPELFGSIALNDAETAILASFTTNVCGLLHSAQPGTDVIAE